MVLFSQVGFGGSVWVRCPVCIPSPPQVNYLSCICVSCDPSPKCQIGAVLVDFKLLTLGLTLVWWSKMSSVAMVTNTSYMTFAATLTNRQTWNTEQHLKSSTLLSLCVCPCIAIFVRTSLSFRPSQWGHLVWSSLPRVWGFGIRFRSSSGSESRLDIWLWCIGLCQWGSSQV